MSCLVIHTDGHCPGPYGQCTCDQIKEQPYDALKALNSQSEQVREEYKSHDKKCCSHQVCGCSCHQPQEKVQLETVSKSTEDSYTADLDALEKWKTKFNDDFEKRRISLKREWDTPTPQSSSEWRKTLADFGHRFTTEYLIEFVEKLLTQARQEGFEDGLKGNK